MVGAGPWHGRHPALPVPNWPVALVLSCYLERGDRVSGPRGRECDRPGMVDPSHARRQWRAMQEGRLGDEIAVNCPPKNSVKWCLRRTDDFTPAQVVSFDFEVRASEMPQCAEEHQHYFAASVECQGLSPRGKRRLRTWAHAIDHDFWRRPEWPGGRYRRQFRIVEALPAGNVRSGPNKRLDRRPFELVPGTDKIIADTVEDEFANTPANKPRKPRPAKTQRHPRLRRWKANLTSRHPTMPNTA